MGSLMYTLVSMVQVASLHCSMRPEISPCSCTPLFNDTIHVTCEGLASFNQVFDSLQNKFSNDDRIWLTITKSQLDDLETKTFKDMNVNITRLLLNHDDLRTLPESSFRNLTNLTYLSLAYNHLEEIPRHVFSHMPRIITMDLADGNVQRIYSDDFRNMNELQHLILLNNQIQTIEKKSIPKTIRNIHLGRNHLKTLNGTLRDNEFIELLLINDNYLETLDNELPINSIYLRSLLAQHNRLQNLTQDISKFHNLDAVFIYSNELKSLNGVFRNASKLQTLMAYDNQIEHLASDEFLRATELQDLQLSNNNIKATNKSLLTLQKLRICNLSKNLIAEFSLNEIRGLKELQIIDLSYNHIDKITGRLDNMVEQDLYFVELRLDHNLLKTLDGAMTNLNRLRTLNLSFNQLKGISPDDLIGLEDLESLDVSHNYLQTLEETSQTFLPRLERLHASFNNLTKLERDFHGLPALCFADLSNNHITQISPDLVAKSRCSNHGVINKLEILLQENPILCMDELSKLFGLMEAQETRLLGIAHCIIPKEEIPSVESVFAQQALPAMPENAILRPESELIKVLIPAGTILNNPNVPADTDTNELEKIGPTNDILPVIISSLANSGTPLHQDDSLKMTSTLQTTTEPSHIDENNFIPSIPTDALHPANDTQSLNTERKDNNSEPIVTHIIDYSTMKMETVTTASASYVTSMLPATTSQSHETYMQTTSSSIDEIVLEEIVSQNPEPDNYIYETFSPASKVNSDDVSNVQRTDHLVLAEKPPEPIPNEAVLAA